MRADFVRGREHPSASSITPDVFSYSIALVWKALSRDPRLPMASTQVTKHPVSDVIAPSFFNFFFPFKDGKREILINFEGSHDIEGHIAA